MLLVLSVAVPISKWFSSMFFCAVNFALSFRLRGFVLSLYPQHGQNTPSHFIKISQT